MAKLPTAKQVYDRIRWDRGLDEHLFTIGYEVRGGAIEEVAFLAFDPNGDIPWHRVRFVRCRDTVVWDRRSRVDALAEVRDKSSG